MKQWSVSGRVALENKLKIPWWGAQSPGREFCQYTRDSIVHKKKDVATLKSVSCNNCRQDKKMIVGEMVAAGKKNRYRPRLSAGFRFRRRVRDVRRIIISRLRRHCWVYYCSGLIRAATELIGRGIIHIVLVEKERKKPQGGENKRPRYQ